MSVKTLDDFRTRRLIGTDDFSIVFWIKEAGELGRLHQITEHHRKLSTFSLGWVSGSWGWFDLRRLILLERRRWCRLVRLRGYCRCPFGIASPDENSALLVRA